jgi:hypothetical protein
MMPHKNENTRAAYGRVHRMEIKIIVLSHYGKGGKLQCCWPDCEVNDIDVLTIDHINNQGAKRRRQGQRSGDVLYRQLKRKKYPKGYQTLCMNHQYKKEIVRVRKNSIMKYGVWKRKFKTRYSNNER